MWQAYLPKLYAEDFALHAKSLESNSDAKKVAKDLIDLSTEILSNPSDSNLITRANTLTHDRLVSQYGGGNSERENSVRDLLARSPSAWQSKVGNILQSMQVRALEIKPREKDNEPLILLEQRLIRAGLAHQDFLTLIDTYKTSSEALLGQSASISDSVRIEMQTTIPVIVRQIMTSYANITSDVEKTSFKAQILSNVSTKDLESYANSREVKHDKSKTSMAQTLLIEKYQDDFDKAIRQYLQSKEALKTEAMPTHGTTEKAKALTDQLAAMLSSYFALQIITTKPNETKAMKKQIIERVSLNDLQNYTVLAGKEFSQLEELIRQKGGPSKATQTLALGGSPAVGRRTHGIFRRLISGGRGGFSAS